MTDTQPLLAVSGAPALLMIEADSKNVAQAASRWQDAGLTVWSVRGRKMRTTNSLFDEMAAALQFPYYFGENWAALDECLGDMAWLPDKAGIVILILAAHEVLADTTVHQLGVLVRLITRAGDEYSRPVASGEWWDRPAIPFHVVLQTPTGLAVEASQRWTAAGASIVPFVV